MLVDFLKSVKEGSQVYFVLAGIVMGGDIMKVDYENEFVQLKTVTFPHGLAVPFFIVPFNSILAWGIRPKN